MHEIRYIEQIDSTNSEIERLISAGESLPDGFVLYTDNQTNGRGQRGNSWTTGKGENLAMSVLVKNTMLPASRQFVLNQWVALSVVAALQKYAEGIKIKWPNDIYYDNKKMCGILIENTLSIKNNQTEIGYSIVGIGVNVNQKVFASNLPNPASLFQIIGKEANIRDLMFDIVDRMDFFKTLVTKQALEQLEMLYYENLYRKDEWHLYQPREVSLVPTQIRTTPTNAFEGCLRGVDLTGQLLLEHRNGQIKHYHFKEIEFVI